MVLRGRGLIALVALVALAISTQAATGRRAAPAGTAVVARGETLSQLARRFGVTVADLARANGITNPDRIRAGRRLVVPAARRSASRAPEDLRRQPERLALSSSFNAAARRYGVPADLLKAVAWQESGWQNHKVSSTKALGIGQLMPDTVTFVNERLLGQQLDPHRPAHNIAMSARFLRYLLDRTNGDVRLAVASYYQGLASVRRGGPLPETERYVANVLALRAKF